MLQAISCIGGVHVLLFSTPFIEIFYCKPPALLTSVMCFPFPLGGLFNIVVYTRPKVAAQMRTGDSWIRSFRVVLMAGGDLPENSPKGSAGSKLRNHAAPMKNQCNVRGNMSENLSKEILGGNLNGVSMC